MADDSVRIEIGLDGGQIMGLQTAQADADRLEHQLASGAGGTVEIEVEEGRCLLVLSRVLYVKRFARGSRVGFGQ